MKLAIKIGIRIFLIAFMVRCYPEYEQTVQQPSPDLSAREVVLVQLEALKNNDVPYKDAGIEIVYRFASPYQRAENGPLNLFSDRFYERRYNPLINFSSSFVEKHFENDKKAEFFVFITNDEGKEQVFLFRLSKQTSAPYEGLWMTDKVIAYADERALTGSYYRV